MAKSSTRRATIYINGKGIEASVKQRDYWTKKKHILRMKKQYIDECF